MINNLPKIPEAVTRLIIVFTAVIAFLLFVRIVVIPPELKDPRIYQAVAIEREKAKEIHFVGSAICEDCHEDEVTQRKNGYHSTLSCEVCHGAAAAHIDDPDETQPNAPRERKFCPTCHTYNPSRPTGFPQIIPIAHNPLQPCITCHDPHDPVPPEVPQECSACHAEIARTKSVSPHVFLDCTKCHETPEEHKTSPRTSRPSKPTERSFCAECHGLDSNVPGTPKVDTVYHGEKYICWQCHYPHMPELN